MSSIIGILCRLIYEIPLVLLQFRVSYIIIRNRKTLTSTFYRLLFFNNTTGFLLWLCVQFVNNYQSWCSTFSFLPPLTEHQRFTSFVMYSLKCFSFTWLICGVFLSLNRLSYFVLKYDKETVWSKLFFVAVLVSVVGPRLVFYEEVGLNSRFILNNGSLLYYYEVEYGERGPINSAYLVRNSSIAELLFLLVIQCILIFMVRLQDRQASSISVRVIQNTNRKFIWICITDFLLHFLWILNDIFLFFTANECLRSVIIISYIFLKELLPILYGVFLIVFDVKLRKLVLGLRAGENNKQNSLISSIKT